MKHNDNSHTNTRKEEAAAAKIQRQKERRQKRGNKWSAWEPDVQTEK